MDQQSSHQVSVSLSVLGIAVGTISLFLPSLVPALPRSIAGAGLAVSALLLVLGMKPLLRNTSLFRRFIPLHEAAGIVYAGTRRASTTAFLEGYGTDEELAVKHFFHEMVRLGTPVYGRTPPARDWVRLGKVDFSKEALWEMRSIKPHHEPVRMTDLSVKRGDLRRLIRALNKEG